MSENRSLIVFGQVHEAEQKFDYFVTGLTGTLCGFIAERYTGAKLGVNAATLEVISILWDLLDELNPFVHRSILDSLIDIAMQDEMPKFVSDGKPYPVLASIIHVLVGINHDGRQVAAQQRVHVAGCPQPSPTPVLAE